MMNITQTSDIRHIFTVAADDKNGVPAYTDALYYQSAPADEQLNADIAARYAGFVATITAAQTAPVPPPPSDDDLVAQIGSLADQQSTLVGQIDDPKTQAALQTPVDAVAQAVQAQGDS